MAKSFGRRPSSARLRSAGRSLRLVRSPLAPKITMMQGGAGCAAAVVRMPLVIGQVLPGKSGRIDLMAGFLFDVPAELETHGGENFSGKVVFAARNEALVQRCSENRSRRRGFDGGEHGPAAFAGIGDAAGEAFELRLF